MRALGTPDAALAAAVKDGDARAFEALLRPHLARLYGLLLRMTGDRRAAEDLAQETALRAFQKLATFQADSGFYTWLYRIAVNLCLRHLERERQLSFDGWPPIADGPDEPSTRELSPEERLLIRQVREGCLTGLVRCLPKDQRLAFVLSVLLGLPAADVAAVLDCSIDAVKTRVSRARKALSAFVDRRCEWIDPSNRCRCRHFVRYSLERGLIAGPAEAASPEEVDADAIEREIDRLRRVALLYESLGAPADPPSLIERIRQGLAAGEWSRLA